MNKDELAFTYFPDNYRWSHGLVLALSGAPWGGGERLAGGRVRDAAMNTRQARRIKA